MNHVFFLPGPVPSKKNSRIVCRSTGRSFPSILYRKWHKQASLFIKPQHNLGLDICKSVYIKFAMSDYRVRDLTNMAESVMDLLVDCGILSDDNWKVCPRVFLCGVKASEPYAKVIINV